MPCCASQQVQTIVGHLLKTPVIHSILDKDIKIVGTCESDILLHRLEIGTFYDF